MGMDVGGNRNGPVSDPNIVPLIDILLVLIIIFMVIAPKVPTGLPTVIPQSPTKSSPPPPEPSTVVVQVLHGGQVMINRDPSDWNALGKRLSAIFEKRADKVAFVRGGDDVSFAEVARAIDIMRGAGIEHVGLITSGTTSEE